MRRTTPLLLVCLAACAAPPSPYFDLVEETTHTTTVPPTRLIDLGTPAGRDHLVEGWSTRDEAREDGTTYVWATGRAAGVRFLSSGDDVEAVRMRCAAPAAAADGQAIAVLLNGERQGTVRLRRGFRPGRVRVDAAALRFGDNRLELVFRESASAIDEPPGSGFAACDWIRVIEDAGADEARA
ncbi:MAG: hypothetical protein ACOC5E_03460, partial [Acidobacteriota bacterium]